MRIDLLTDTSGRSNDPVIFRLAIRTSNKRVIRPRHWSSHFEGIGCRFQSGSKLTATD
jgi:hypothetical protein